MLWCLFEKHFLITSILLHKIFGWRPNRNPSNFPLRLYNTYGSSLLVYEDDYKLQYRKETNNDLPLYAPVEGVGLKVCFWTFCVNMQTQTKNYFYILSPVNEVMLLFSTNMIIIHWTYHYIMNSWETLIVGQVFPCLQELWLMGIKKTN